MYFKITLRVRVPLVLYTSLSHSLYLAVSKKQQPPENRKLYDMPQTRMRELKKKKNEKPSNHVLDLNITDGFSHLAR
jgi:hypothetical protein